MKMPSNIINGEFNSEKIRDEIWEIYKAYASILPIAI
jgi:hypothetical protein